MPDLSANGDHLLRGSSGEPAPGPREDPRAASILGRAASLRFPDLRHLDNRSKINALVDHITDTAIARGELEDLRLEAHANLLGFRRRFNRLLPGHRFSSKARADEARRLADPQLTEEIEGASWLVARCTEQINRLGGTDYDAASRAYTVLAG